MRLTLSFLRQLEPANLSALLAVQLLDYALPLALIPFLSRTLGPVHFGNLAVVQSFSAYITVLTQYGFNYSGARLVAQASTRTEAHVAQAVRDILGAKLLLGTAGVGIAGVVFLLSPQFRSAPALFWAAVLAGLANGMTMVWFYLGIQRIYVASLLEASGRILSVIIILFVVKGSADSYKVVMIQSICTGLAIIGEIAFAHRRVSLLRPTVRSSLVSLREGWYVFLSRCAESVYLTGGSYLLGLARSPMEVGHFAAAEKVVRAAAYGLFPFYQVSYPRLVVAAATNRRRAVVVFLRITGFVVCIAVLGGISIFFYSREIVEVLLGPQFRPSVPLLKTLAVLPAITILAGGIGSNLMIGLGYDAAFTKILAFVSVISFCAILGLSARAGATGTALALIGTQVLLAVLAAGYLYAKGELEVRR